MAGISFSGTTRLGPFWKQVGLKEKNQTVREPRKRKIKEGETLYLYWKMRVPIHEKPVHKIGEATCTRVDQVQYKDFCEDLAFARKDGFSSLREMHRWFGDPREYGSTEYEVIQWGNTLNPTGDLLLSLYMIFQESPLKPKITLTNEIVEAISDLEHRQWVHWTSYFLENLSVENIERWKRQIQTKYQDLSEAEKESDRSWARHVFSVLQDLGFEVEWAEKR